MASLKRYLAAGTAVVLLPTGYLFGMYVRERQQLRSIDRLAKEQEAELVSETERQRAAREDREKAERLQSLQRAHFQLSSERQELISKLEHLRERQAIGGN